MNKTIKTYKARNAERHVSVILLMLLSVLVFSACSNSRHLQGDSLFVGSTVTILDREAGKKERKIIANDLEGIVRPKPNTKFLGIRLKLSLYNLAGDPKKTKGIRKWLRKIGEPPVLASSVNLNLNRDLMINHMENRGFFYSKVGDSMRTNKKKKSKADFWVSTGPQYKIKEIHFRNDSSQIAHDIDSAFNELTLLKPGAPYNLELIKAERVRIDRVLKERGYFYFKPDYILVVADTSIGDRKVNMYVRLKHREIPPEAYQPFTINDIYIYANYRLRGNRQDTGKEGKVEVDNYYVIDKRKRFKPEIFSRAMIFEKGDLYSLDDQNTSLSRLVNMGTFKFVKNRFEPVGDSLLDVYYYLTPYPAKSIRFEVGLLTQNDNRAGTQGSISWRHRNAFKGAEEFVIKLNGGFEAQYGGIVKQPNIYNFGAETNIAFPRFVVPFIDINTLSQYLPRTIIKLKYNYEAQTGLLRINSYSASYGYDWKEGPRKSHQLYPFNFTYVKTDTFKKDYVERLLYGNLVFNGIIIGPTYQFTYNSQAGPTRKNAIYFNGLIDLSGNVLGLVQKADYKDNPKQLFGSTFAQYAKLQPDFRYYRQLSEGSVLASRVLLGLGIPYGNSAHLPNIKQFWAGGNSDLRGFQSRLVGPGSFVERDSLGNINRTYIQILGDIKMEMNVELRQHIYKFINVGVFADAGNIWLYRPDTAFKGGEFSSKFYKEFAANAGFGLRFDFKILILRLDLGMPIRKPWLPEEQRWVFDKINFSDRQWRRENLILNIAIGYPF